jgi:hypothetical protein
MSDATQPASVLPPNEPDIQPSFWTPERVSQLKWCLSQGMSYADIATQFGTTRCAVGGAVKRNNLGQGQPVYWTPERLDELRHLLRANKTNVQIGQHFDLPTSNITTAINRYALGKLRPRRPGQNARHEGKPRASRNPSLVPFVARSVAREPTVEDILADLPQEVRDLPADQSPDAVPLYDLPAVGAERGRCHWPLDGLMMCGTIVHGKSPYCVRHHARAFRRATPSRTVPIMPARNSR